MGLRRGLPLWTGVGVLVLAVLLAACGSDGAAPGPDGVTTPTATLDPGGSDEDYVRVYCTASLAFESDLSAAAAELLARGIESLGDEAALNELVVPPLERYVIELRRANPPADVRPFHEDLVQAVEAQTQRISTGGFDAEEFGEAPFADLVEPPPAIQSRLAAAAAAVSDCDGGGFFR